MFIIIITINFIAFANLVIWPIMKRIANSHFNIGNFVDSLFIVIVDQVMTLTDPRTRIEFQYTYITL